MGDLRERDLRARERGPERADADLEDRAPRRSHVPRLLREVRALVSPDAAALASLERLGRTDARALGAALGLLVDARPNAASARPPLPSRRPSGSEQRRAPRASYRTPVRLEVPGFGAVDGRSEDISALGLLVVARAEVQPGTKVNVRFALPVDGRIVTEPAIVKWVRSAHENEAAGLRAVGLELVSASPETTQQVERYVTLIGAEPSAPR